MSSLSPLPSLILTTPQGYKARVVEVKSEEGRGEERKGRERKGEEGRGDEKGRIVQTE